MSTLAPPATHEREKSLSAIVFHVNESDHHTAYTAGTSANLSSEGRSTRPINTSNDTLSRETNSVEMQSNPASPTATTKPNSPTAASQYNAKSITSTSSSSDITEPGGRKPFFERTEGWNRPVVWATFAVIVGIIDWVLPLFFPAVVSLVMRQQICDKLCVPIPAPGWVEDLNNPNDWKLNNFLTNTNSSWWPVEYFSVYLYHVNNSDAVIAGKEPKLKVQVVGPYVFTTYRQKYNVSFTQDNTQVFYNSLTSFTFQPQLSGNRTLNDKITVVNMPLVSINYIEDVVANSPMYSLFGQFCVADPRSCLFQKTLPVQQILFGSTSSAYGIANILMKNQLASTFQLFFNESKNTKQADIDRLTTSFGMGGNLHTFVGSLATVNRTYPYKAGSMNINATGRPSVNDSLLNGQYTGQGSSYGQLFGFTQYKGNTSINVWNGPEYIRGTDHFQFSPPLTPNSILTVWDDDIMRTVDLQFQEKVSILDKYDAYRFIPTDGLFGGTDPHYFGMPGFEGTLFVSPASMIKYGAPVSAYATRPYMAGVNSNLANSVICTNCPDMTDPNNWLDVYVDVEPNTGKVLGGKKRGQLNALIGQPDIYGSPEFTKYQNISLSLVPLVYFEYSSQIEVGGQTDQLDDGLDQVKLARVGTAVVFYLIAPLSALHFLAAFIIAVKADEKGACCGRHHAGKPLSA